MRRLFASTVARLVAAIFVLQLLSGAAAISLLRTQMLQQIESEHRREVLDVRDDLLAAYYDGGHDELAKFILERWGTAADPLIFAAVTGKGTPVLGHIAAVPEIPAGAGPQRVRVVRATGLPPSEAMAMAMELPDGTRLIVGAVSTTEHRLNLAFAEAITLTVALTMVLAFAGALLLGLIISRRTHAIAETAEALASGDFAARVPYAGTGDGFDHLRRQMNLMAERIDTLVKQVRSISGALAHDLRSPVARLRASIDTALEKDPSGEAASALHRARADADELDSMLSTALELNRLESGSLEDHRTILDVGEIGADLVELYEPLAEQSGVSLEAAMTGVKALADRELLSRALANLIDNALKYGGDRVTVTTLPAGEWVEIAVADNGPGIAVEDRARAVDRFTKLDNARSRPGVGLGLAMVAAVAQLHGGSLELSGSDGLVATIRLPLA